MFFIRYSSIELMLQRFFVAGLLLTLAACGGGSGSGGGSDGDDGDGGSPTEPGTATVSGTITVATNSFVDSDTNDRLQNQQSNNGTSIAQALPNPVAVGGYVDFGQTGNPSANGCENNAGSDPIDFFQVQLFEDQFVELIIADRQRGDLDLFLLNDAAQIVDGSNSADSNESVIVPSDGNYFVVVCAYSEGSNYTLSVGQGSNGFATRSNSPMASTYRLSSPIIAGDVIVAWQNTARSSAQAKATNTLTLQPTTIQATGAINLVQKSVGGFGTSLMTMDTASKTALVQQTKATFTQQKLAFASAELAERYATLKAIKAVHQESDVAFAEPNFLRQAMRVPNDRGYEFQWHYPLIDLPEAWDTTVGSSDVIVAVIDTGVLLEHPDLVGQFDPNDPTGYDFISDSANAGDGNGRDGNANDVGDNRGQGSSFHGTHVAGTIAARTNNDIGVAGVAWNAKIMPLRALGRDGGSSFDIQQAVLYAAGLSNASGTRPARAADIINLSLGGPGGSQSEQNVYNRARAQGLIIIAAAGNENTSQPSFPAAYSGVVSVSAVDQEKRLARYSNFGSTIDVAAPGGDTARDVDGDGYADGVLSAGGNDTSGEVDFVYPFFQGTSMAAPHVAGVAALMKSVNPNLTPNQFDQMLSAGLLTEDIGIAGRDNSFGFGLINARKAVQAAVGGTPPSTPGLIQVDPSSLGFGVFLNELELDVSSTGTEDTSTLPPVANAPWLVVTPVQTEAGTNLGCYLATVNRTGLPDGAYEAEITFTGTNNTVVVPVIMQVGAAFEADLGVHYILLIDDGTNQIVAQDVVRVDGGEYDYEFTEVPAGSYRIIAGSDYDEDFIVCDRGEACGAFITLDDPVVVNVGATDITGLDFTSGYEASFNASSTNSNPAAKRITTDELIKPQ